MRKNNVVSMRVRCKSCEQNGFTHTTKASGVTSTDRGVTSYEIYCTHCSRYWFSRDAAAKALFERHTASGGEVPQPCGSMALKIKKGKVEPCGAPGKEKINGTWRCKRHAAILRQRAAFQAEQEAEANDA